MNYLVKLAILLASFFLSAAEGQLKENSGALFLTPYISAGQIEEAKKLAAVENLSPNVKSFSGLVTTDQENGVHTFFWFFPAVENYETAPVFLWSEGGPGVTGLHSIFNENGPFLVDAAGVLHLRNTTWATNHSMIYMDQPMDVGFSFTEKEEGYVSSPTDTAPNVYNFLLQFFKLFPELKKNDFYNSGVSFGGIYAPIVASYILRQNKENPESHINLKGMILETPLSDPISQIDYGDYLYHVGLIDEIDRAYFKEQAETIKTLINSGNFSQAAQINFDLLLGSQFGSYFTNISGYTTAYNLLRDGMDPAPLYFYQYVQTEEFRSLIHVGNLTFNFVSPLVQKTFRPSFLKSVKQKIEELLDSSLDFKLLVYSGNLDISTYHVGVEAMVNNLEWSGAKVFSSARRQIWRVNGEVAGYAKTTRNLTYVLVRNAGHGAAGDQQNWVLDLVNRFSKGIPFS